MLCDMSWPIWQNHETKGLFDQRTDILLGEEVLLQTNTLESMKQPVNIQTVGPGTPIIYLAAFLGCFRMPLVDLKLTGPSMFPMKYMPDGHYNTWINGSAETTTSCFKFME